MVPARRTVEPGDQAQERGLPASRGPHEDHELAGLDLEVDAMDDLHAAELLGDAAKRDLAHPSLPT
jgi:hypothetical protein